MRRSQKNPWLIPFLILVVVMAISMVAILQSASGSSQDIRSRAFDDVREVPNGQIPRATGAITVTPRPSGFKLPPIIITGVRPVATSSPLLKGTPRPTVSVTPYPLPPCNIVLLFMRRPCIAE